MNRMGLNKVKDDKRTPDIIYDEGSIVIRRVHKNKSLNSVPGTVFTILLVLGLMIIGAGNIQNADAYSGGDVIYINGSTSDYTPNSGQNFTLTVTLTDFDGNGVSGKEGDGLNDGIYIDKILDKDGTSATTTFPLKDGTVWTDNGDGTYTMSGNIAGSSSNSPYMIELRFKDPANVNYQLRGGSVTVTVGGSASSTVPSLFDSAPDYVYYPSGSNTVVAKVRLLHQDASAHTGTTYDALGNDADSMRIKDIKDENGINISGYAQGGFTDNGDGTYDITINYSGAVNNSIYLARFEYMYDAAGNTQLDTTFAFEVNDTQAPSGPTGTPPANPGCTVCAGPTDVTAPVAGTVTPSSTDYNSQYVDSPYNLSTTFTDNESAVTSCEYTTDGSSWSAATVSGSGPYTCTKTGITASNGASLALNMRATSGGGTTTASSVSRTADAAAPATTDDYPGGTVTSDPTVTLSPVDAGSGVASTVYCVDQTNSCSPSTSGTSASVTGTPGVLSVWYVRYYSTDNVGNSESVNSTTVTIDHTCSPAVAITGFNPTQGIAGTTSVTIDGSGFGASRGTGFVKFFNNQTAAITSWNDTQIIVTVSAGATTGAITVQSDATCSSTSGSNFGVCTRSDPGITFIPSSGSIKAGQNQAYTVRITNNDQYCADSSFSYSLGSETGDTGSFTLSSTFTDGSTGALASGGTYDTSLTVTADSVATVGHQLNTAINIAADGNHGAVSNTVTTTIIPDWSDNSMLLHNANRFGDCTNDTYDGTSQTDCEAAGGTWTPTAKWSGNWGLGSGKYGGITCETCHADTTTNIKKIKTSITAPDTGDSFPGQTGGKTISFLNPSTDFGDPASNSWNICEYCHSTTSYHKYNQSATHNGQVDCTDCHTHKSGFVGSGDCISCHSSAQGSGGYRRQVAGTGGDIDSGKTFHHVSYSTLDVATCQVCHDQANHKSNTDPGVLLNDPDGGAAITYTGTASQLTSFCLNCHDGDNETPFTDSGDSTNMNTTNLNIETSWTATYNHSADAECVDCHGDSGGDGSTTAPYLNGHGGDNALYLQGTGATDQAISYDTCVTGGCHGAGGSATVDMTVELSGTGGKHPIDGVVVPMSSNISNSLLVNGWTVSSTTACGDCHGMNGGGPRGPHGSSYQYILKGVDTTVVSGGTPTNSDITNQWWLVENLCINCHDASVYGLGGPVTSGGDNTVPSRNNLSPIQHYSGNIFREDRCASVDTVMTELGTLQNIACTNCHSGAGRNYGAHSSTYQAAQGSTVWTTAGAGFMNGNSWTQAPANNAGGSCYAIASATAWSTCDKGQHD